MRKAREITKTSDNEVLST